MKYLNILACIFLLSCQSSIEQSPNQQSGIFKKINKKEFAKKLLEKKEKILIDVRTPEEFQLGTIQDARNINFYDSNFEKELSKIDKSKPVFIFCKSGGRSGKALKKMKTMEFREVYDLKGGYLGWN